MAEQKKKMEAEQEQKLKAIAAELANPSCCEAAAALAEFNVFLSLALRLLNQTCTRASVNLVLEENERLQI